MSASASRPVDDPLSGNLSPLSGPVVLVIAAARRLEHLAGKLVDVDPSAALRQLLAAAELRHEAETAA